MKTDWAQEHRGLMAKFGAPAVDEEIGLGNMGVQYVDNTTDWTAQTYSMSELT